MKSALAYPYNVGRWSQFSTGREAYLDIQRSCKISPCYADRHILRILQSIRLWARSVSPLSPRSSSCQKHSLSGRSNTLISQCHKPTVKVIQNELCWDKSELVTFRQSVCPC